MAKKKKPSTKISRLTDKKNAQQASRAATGEAYGPALPEVAGPPMPTSGKALKTVQRNARRNARAANAAAGGGGGAKAREAERVKRFYARKRVAKQSTTQGMNASLGRATPGKSEKRIAREREIAARRQAEQAGGGGMFAAPAIGQGIGQGRGRKRGNQGAAQAIAGPISL